MKKIKYLLKAKKIKGKYKQGGQTKKCLVRWKI